MNKEIKMTVKKTAKIAGVTCVALGSAALIASGAALKALTEGAKYLKESVRKIIDEEPRDEAIVEEAAVVEASPEDFAEEEAVVAEGTTEAQETAAE